MSNQLLRIRPSVVSRSFRFSPSVKRKASVRFVLVATFFVLFLVGSAPRAIATTALDTYIEKVDASAGFSVAATIPGPGFTSYNIDLTSQTWRDPSEVIQSWKDPSDPTQNQWEHKMTIVQPDSLITNTAILLINGGSGPDSFPSPTSSEFQQMAGAALATNSVFVSLPTVPNQSLKFAGEDFTRTEDAIIAKTFKKFLDNDPSDSNVDEWPLLLPMVKSAVAAMDATQEHMQNQGITIDKFFIFGGSKRGWTTWLTAAVEARPGGPNRVSGIAPGVIDFLNIDESLQHQRQVYEGVTEKIIGGFAQSVGDYVLEGVLDQLAPLPGQQISARAQELLDIVDPFEYRDRLTIPKYIVNSTGDQFFVPDSSQFYFDDLSEQKYLRYIPNSDHGLDDSAIEGALLFHSILEAGLPLPEFSWEISPDGTSIIVTLESGTPMNVRVWEATNPNNRDFRKETFGANWVGSDLVEQSPGSGIYAASRAAPATGATAFMIELEYDFGGQSLKFTTDISVAQVPEPASGVLLFSCLIIAGASVRRAGRR